MNTVIAGDHLYGTITYKNKKKGFEILNTSCLGLKKEKTYINKETVESWEIFEENGKKSFAAPQKILCKRFSTKSRISRFQSAW